MKFTLVFVFVLISCTAGNIQRPSTRMNGELADLTEFKYVVAVEYEKLHRCTGTILGSNLGSTWIVTVANCVIGCDIEGMQIRAAAPLRGVMGELRAVRNKIVHPQFNSINNDNDIALLEVDEYVESDTIGGIAIGIEVPEYGTPVSLAGFGAPTTGEWLADSLQNSTIPIFYLNDCRYYYGSLKNEVTNNMFCAGEEGAGVCQGDSGDPLVYDNMLIGMSSWSYGCAQKKYPGVFTAVYNYKDWIQEATGLVV